jgi:hypothetical protein
VSLIILVIFQALGYVFQYQVYSAVWSNDQSNLLSNFLKYARELTPEEQETLQFEVDAEGEPLLPLNAPKLSDFQTKVRVVIDYIF